MEVAGTKKQSMDTKKEKKNEVFSRRAFFKNAAKATLPILAIAMLSGLPGVVRAAQESPMGCNNGCVRTCEGSCKGACSGCSHSCSGSINKVGQFLHKELTDFQQNFP